MQSCVALAGFDGILSNPLFGELLVSNVLRFHKDRVG